MENANWVMNYLKAIEASGQHAPVETMQRVIDAHDALVAALEKIVEVWPAHGSITQNSMADAMAQVARAALAKAKG